MWKYEGKDTVKHEMDMNSNKAGNTSIVHTKQQHVLMHSVCKTRAWCMIGLN